MSELYDAVKGIDKRTFFNHLLLESELTDLISTKPDTSKLEVKLTINDIVVRVADFNEVLSNWSDRIEADIMERLDFLNSERAVVAKAEQLLEDKLSSARELLDHIENNSWILNT